MTVPVSSPAVTLEDVKERLRITTSTQDDVLGDFLAGALAEYEEHVGPVDVTTYTETLPAGSVLILTYRPVLDVESVTDGSALTVADLHVDRAVGLIRWPHGASRYGFGRGTTVVYTAGGLPANHREAILMDVEGLWRNSQRGAGSGGARSALVGGDDLYERANYSAPMTLYPRIRALAGSSVA